MISDIYLYHACTKTEMVFIGLLRSKIDRLKQERNITPKLVFIHGAHDDTTAFERYLIEDQSVDGSLVASATGFRSFLEGIRSRIAEYSR